MFVKHYLWLVLHAPLGRWLTQAVYAEIAEA